MLHDVRYAALTSVHFLLKPRYFKALTLTVYEKSLTIENSTKKIVQRSWFHGSGGLGHGVNASVTRIPRDNSNEFNALWMD